jgi:hypothetical protein
VTFKQWILFLSGVVAILGAIVAVIVAVQNSWQ